MLQSAHGFLMYQIYAHAHGATPIKAAETNLTANVDALLEAVTERTKLLFLANPNNPTGTYLPASKITRLRENLPEHVLLVLDGAYAEYVETPDYEPGKTLVESTENTVMLRTFSKLYGLPALRSGWAYAPEAVVDALQRVRSPFNVNSAAMQAGIAAMEDVAYTTKSVAHNNTERARLTAACTQLGLHVVPSAGNFILVQFADAKAANAHLTAANIIAREVAEYGLPDYLRITVGTEAENDAVIAALEEFCA